MQWWVHEGKKEIDKSLEQDHLKLQFVKYANDPTFPFFLRHTSNTPQNTSLQPCICKLKDGDDDD